MVNLDPNVSVLNASGLSIESNSDIISYLTSQMQIIYGADANFDSNSPDGQLIQIFSQAITDYLEALVQTYNSFSIENAFGQRLDQLVALNGLARKAGSFTIANVAVTASAACSLVGQDALISNPAAVVFTVADNAGNQYQLVTSYNFSGAGSATLLFAATTLGAIQTIANTITNIITTVLGIASVNNPVTTSDVIGLNEETDVQLKIRHGQSFELAATGPADSVEAALMAIQDVLDAYVTENFTNGAVGGVQAHSIWCVVRGGTAPEIGQAIYAKKGVGCGMKGSVTSNIARPNGSVFVAAWDTALSQRMYAKFTLQRFNTSVNYDPTTIAQQLAAALSFKLNQTATIGQIAIAMQAIAPGGYLVTPGVSTDGVTYVSAVTPTSALYYFALAAADIAVTVL